MPMHAEDWKQLLVLSHALATGGHHSGAARIVPNLEGGGFIQIRESTARMSKARAASLIEYTVAWATAQGIPLSAPQQEAA